MDATPSLWRESGIVWGGTIVAAALALAIQLILARHLSPAGFGSFSNIYVIATLVGIFGFQGIGEITMRHPGGIRRRTAIRALFVMSALGMGGAGAWLAFADIGSGDWTLLLAFLPFTIVHVGLLAGMVGSQVRRRSNWIAAWPAILQAGRLLPLIALVLAGGTETEIPIAWALCLLFPAILGTRMLAKAAFTEPIDDEHGIRSTGRLVGMAFPFSITRVLEFAEIQLPVILAMAMAGADATAWVAAALALVQGMLLLPIAVFQRLLRPRFHGWGRTDPPRLVRVALGGAAIMAAIGAVIALVVRPFAGWLLDLTFGDGFQPAADFFSTTLLILPIWFASIAVNAALVTPRDAYLRSILQGVGVATLALAALVPAKEGGLDGILVGLFLCQAILLGSGIVILLTGRSPDHRAG